MYILDCFGETVKHQKPANRRRMLRALKKNKLLGKDYIVQIYQLNKNFIYANVYEITDGSMEFIYCLHEKFNNK